MNNIGVSYKRQGHLSEAIEMYSQSLSDLVEPASRQKSDMENFFPHYNLGVALSQSKDYEKAIAEFQLSLDIVSDQS